MEKDTRALFDALSLSPADILLPRDGIDIGKWAVVACDQFTSQKEYWQEADRIVGSSPSTLRLIYPECFLEDDDKEERIKAIDKAMEDYLASGVFEEFKDAFILVERTTESGSRYGLVGKLDLEAYSYEKDSRSLVRATEGTILSRIPPRKEIRRDAALELPHIMVLISDERRLVIEPLVARRPSFRVVYDSPLMLGGGHIKGYLIDREEDLRAIAQALGMLKAALDPANPLLYAMGDGNHSLATAKSLYEDLKKEVGDAALSSPARHALVEIENIFDPALNFEAIHRTFFNLPLDAFKEVLSLLCQSHELVEVSGLEEMRKAVEVKDGTLRFGIRTKDRCAVCKANDPSRSLSASLIQAVIDSLAAQGRGSVDYIHGADVAYRLGLEDGNIGIILPEISKDSFFESIVTDGAFPRKTFSIGHAEEKRYYLEARRIR
ncbi:MAG: DUF1015 domain-containing protein [Spirochaetes bacterium]|uniref:DUF1015 domain-containing protein n=1 Tax=Candidatus Aphodenecus pullistercoris TaxID=2840669 RepID=A0A9D9HAU8_9SPIR|nr:DUF1015 domain-containing protein [Candidatus Aphodenecus pullistercoris]